MNTIRSIRIDKNVTTDTYTLSFVYYVNSMSYLGNVYLAAEVVDSMPDTILKKAFLLKVSKNVQVTPAILEELQEQINKHVPPFPYPTADSWVIKWNWENMEMYQQDPYDKPDKKVTVAKFWKPPASFGADHNPIDVHYSPGFAPGGHVHWGPNPKPSVTSQSLRLPGVNTAVTYPCAGQKIHGPEGAVCTVGEDFKDILWSVIQHLNDVHRWNREKIADWIDELHDNGIINAEFSSEKDDKMPSSWRDVGFIKEDEVT